MSLLGIHTQVQMKDYMMGLRNYKPMKVYQIIDEIRRTDAKSKGMDCSANSGELLKELVYKILH